HQTIQAMAMASMVMSTSPMSCKMRISLPIHLSRGAIAYRGVRRKQKAGGPVSVPLEPLPDEEPHEGPRSYRLVASGGDRGGRKSAATAPVAVGKGEKPTKRSVLPGSPDQEKNSLIVIATVGPGWVTAQARPVPHPPVHGTALCCASSSQSSEP